MTTWLRSIVVLLTVLAVSPAAAVQPEEVLEDPRLESRARDLSRELRCMVCQNQSIDDSDAPLAKDLRLLVRERLTAGDSDEQVLQYLTVRFGDFVLLRPRFTAQTAVLWIVPAVLVVIGISMLIGLARRQGKGTAALVQLSSAEQARLNELIAQKKD